MRVYIRLTYFISVIFIYCNNVKKDFKEESKAVSKVIEIFGGNCKYSVESSVSNKSNDKSFELELSQSAVVEEFLDKLLLPASGIAYTFYKHIQRSKYSKIRVILYPQNKPQQVFEFPTNILGIVEKKMPTIDAIIDKLKLKEYQKISDYLDNSSIITYKKADLINDVKKIEDGLGQVIDFIPLGFRFDELNSQKIVHISGIIKREKENSYFSADFNTLDEKSKAVLINYEL